MREKLLELLKCEGLKPSQLAEILEINPAGISHILAGRNKPSFELLQKILRRFPRINPDWLLLDSDQIYRKELPSDAASASSGNPNIHPSKEVTNPSLFAAASNADSSQNSAQVLTAKSPGEDRINPENPAHPSGGNSQKSVRRVVIFYDDQTFEDYTPTVK